VTARIAATILLVGLAGSLAATVLLDVPAREALKLGGLAGAASLAVGLAVALLLHVLRRTSITTQLLLVTLGTVAAVAAGESASAQTMFASTHPYPALVLVLVCSGTVSALAGLSLSHRVREASKSLAETARALGEPDRPGGVDAPPTDELARLGEELELTARRLEESRARADRLEAARRELVAWISHDLRTPLARIRAVVEALEDGVLEDPEEVEAFYGRLRSETDRLSGLVDSLFELSRIDAGAIALDIQPLALADIVSDLVVSFTPLARERGIDLQAHRHAQPVVDGSMEHLERAISNLLDNAIRYGDSGSAVLVETGVDDGSAFVSISDSCGGLSGEELARILEVAGKRRWVGSQAAGTGLGLAIAKGLVEAQGGTISAEADEVTCRFVVTLPGAIR
jgi:signal transduction histidine kinase